MNTETMRFRSGDPRDPVSAFQIDYRKGEETAP